nr:hypothetical protein [bacterium]
MRQAYPIRKDAAAPMAQLKAWLRQTQGQPLEETFLPRGRRYTG